MLSSDQRKDKELLNLMDITKRPPEERSLTHIFGYLQSEFEEVVRMARVAALAIPITDGDLPFLHARLKSKNSHISEVAEKLLYQAELGGEHS